ncbi:antibiotic ABC transporter [Amaricoccus sp.]|uniref:antibiotic ABC transporter n=1 Tax=Amaricoccus sp. TaxID=1872485 RepID=UPI001B6E7352|nr:antibiotic ABC transporter [Amaricoccus sp.]MBP7243135.1 antibiotic ABC transporter [Amaricoccus sp.]
MPRATSPFTALIAWGNLTQSYARMSLAAGEVILRRTMQMASGTMTPHEAVAMVMEKPAAFATSAERAAVAAARGGDVTRIASAALRPYGAKTRSNVRRLRK